MILESDTKFEEKMTCGLENNMRKFENFESTWMYFDEKILKSPRKLGLKIGTFMGDFCAK